MEPFDARELMMRVVAQLEISRIQQYNRQAILAAQEQYRQLNTALRLSRERYKSLMMVTAAIVWTAAPDGRIYEDVPMWEVFTGQTSDEYKGYGWLNALHPDDRDSTLSLWIDALEIKHPIEALFRVRLRDGTYQQMLAVGLPVLNLDGSVWEWVGTITEVRGGEPPLYTNLSVY
jgi:PAS domain S-box-containing protein